MSGSGLMTIGELSRRSGTPVKALRAWTDMGLVYSAGRSPAGYRLFDESALWCIAVVGELRGLGLTLAELRELAGVYLGRPAEPIGPHVAGLLRRARDRADAQIARLTELRERIDQVGCVLFAPVDAIERGRRGSRSPAARQSGLSPQGSRTVA